MAYERRIIGPGAWFKTTDGRSGPIRGANWFQRGLVASVGAVLAVAAFLIALPLLLIGAVVAAVVAVVLWFKYRRLVRSAQRQVESVFQWPGGGFTGGSPATPDSTTHSPPSADDPARQNVRVRRPAHTGYNSNMT